MAQTVNMSNRDVALLRFLDLTPATAAEIRRASVTFAGKPFRDERRARERMQALGDAGFVKGWPAAISGGGLMFYFRLTLEGYRVAYTDAADAPPRATLNEIAPSRLGNAADATGRAAARVLILWTTLFRTAAVLGQDITPRPSIRPHGMRTKVCGPEANQHRLARFRHVRRGGFWIALSVHVRDFGL